MFFLFLPFLHNAGKNLYSPNFSPLFDFSSLRWYIESIYIIERKCSFEKIDISLSPSDVKAILCALQIVPLVVTNNPIQMEINISNAASGAEKLLSCPEELTPNELRIISGAVSASLLYIRNPDNNMFSSSEAAYRRELSQYLFTLNRLDPILQKAIGL